MARSFRVADHTADMALEVRGDTLAEMFTAAAEGLARLYTPSDVTGADLRFEYRKEAASIERLLVEFLSEMVYLHEMESMVFGYVEVELEEPGPDPTGDFRVDAVVTGEKYDPERHEMDSPVKAVTQHMLAVEKGEAGWTATIIMDT